jgi:hypothetical protein
MFKITQDAVISKILENGYTYDRKGLLGDSVYANPNISDHVGPVRFVIVAPSLSGKTEYTIRLSLDYFGNMLTVTENEIFLNKLGREHNTNNISEDEFWGKLQSMLTEPLNSVPGLVPFNENDELVDTMERSNLDDDNQTNTEELYKLAKVTGTLMSVVEKLLDAMNPETLANNKDDDRPVYL